MVCKKKNLYPAFELKDGFYQVELAEETRLLTAVNTVIGFFRYTWFSQWLKNSRGILQIILNAAL